MIKQTALYTSSLLAVTTAIYHGILGDEMMQALPLEAADMALVRATFQIGTMGWLMGGVLLFAAARIDSQQARNWIIWVLCALYGLPAVGNFMLNGGQPSFGWMALALVVVLALFGRAQSQPKREVQIA